jgi:hypothetical protein
MKKYRVMVKQIYVYDGVPAKTKAKAVQKVLDMDWIGHDECEEQLETSAEIEEL